MKTAKLALFVGVLSLSAVAFASRCPMDMKKIDEALAKNPQVSAEVMADVKKWRAEGEALHNAGKHRESEEALAKAMKALNI